MGKPLKTSLSEAYVGTSTRDAVETAIESSKGDKLIPWEEFVDSESERISRWNTKLRTSESEEAGKQKK